MNRTQWKDLLREIRKNRGRFLSLLFIVALGCAFYTGIRSSEPDMTMSADRYYDEVNFCDIRVVSTLGLTDEDLEAVSKIDGIVECEGTKSTELFAVCEEDQPVLNVVSLGEKINRFSVKEGRLPEKEDECFMDVRYMTMQGVEIGDTVTVMNTDKEAPEELSCETFTIVGYGTWAWYLNLTRGTASIGDGSVDAFMVLLPESFTTDYYTNIYATVEGAAEENTYSDRYDEIIDAVKERLEGIADVQVALRHDSIVSEGEEAIADAKVKIADARQELADAEQELTDGEQEYADGLQEYNDGVKELEDGRADYESGLAKWQDGVREYEDGLSKYKDGKKKYEDGLAQYNDGVKALDEGKATLAASEQKLKDGKSEYENGLARWQEGDALLAEKEAEAAAGETELAAAEQNLAEQKAGLLEQQTSLQATKEDLTKQKEDLEQQRSGLVQQKESLLQQKSGLEQQKESLLQQKSSLESQKAGMEARLAELESQKSALEAAGMDTAEIDAGIAGLQSGIAQAEAGIAQIEGGLPQIESGIARIDAGLPQIEGGIAQIDGGLPQLEAGIAQVDDGLSQIEAGLSQIAAGEETLAAKRAELEAGKEQLTSARAELDRNKELLDQSAEEIRSGETALAEGKKEIEKNQTSLIEAKKVLNSSKKELSAAEQQLADAKKELDDGEQELADAKAKLTDGEQELADAKVTLTDARKELDKGWREFRDGQAEADDKIADAEAEIADGEQQLRDLEEGEWYVLTRDEIQTCVEYGMDAERIGKIASVFPLIFFLVAALVSLTTMTRMIEEERMLIGTMKAMGYGKFAIISKYLVYAASATLVGGVGGVLIGGKILPYVIMTAYGMLYTNVPYILMPYDLTYCLTSIGMALLCTVGAAFAACYRELLSTPAELMRPPAPKVGKKILLERIGWIWKRLNFSMKSTLRNLFRYKKRFFMTVVGIGGCMAVLLVSYGLHDSIAAIVDNQYKKVWTYSVYCSLDEKLDEEEKAAISRALAAEPEIEGSMLARNVSLDISTEAATKTAYLYVVEGTEEMKGFLSLHDRVTKEEHTLTDEGVVLSEKAARMLAVEPGDTITLKISDSRYKTVTVTDTAENYLYNYVYMTPAFYEKVYGEPVVWNECALVYGEPLAEETENRLAERLLATEGVTAVHLTRTLQETVDNMMNALNLVVWVLVVAAGLLVFVVSFNLNNINISERRRELASLKVLGFHDMEVAMYVYRENIFLTLFGIFAGLFMGTALHRYVITTLEVEMIMFGRKLSLESYLYSSLLTIVFSVIVNVLMFYKLKQIDMVESLKSVE